MLRQRGFIMLAGNPEKNISGGARLIALVADSGSAAHPTIIAALKDLRNLNSPDLSDIAHFLCVLHGRYPGLIDHAARKIVDGAAREWILHTGNAFAEERAFLSRLTAAAGPAPSTMGDEKCTAAFAMQSRALEMLASSDRQVYPARAAIAFAEDWLTIRMLLESMAEALEPGADPGGEAAAPSPTAAAGTERSPWATASVPTDPPALLGWLAGQSGFYAGLGVQPNIAAPNDALALVLFLLALPPLTFFAAPLGALLSRRHEFEADAYACAQADGRALASALVKLHEDNAATLTPDPWYVRFYYSHPPAAERLAALPAPVHT